MNAPPMPPWHEKLISEFLDAGATFRSVMVPYVAIVALKGDDQDTIISARLTFASPTAALPEKSFESNTIRAVGQPLGSPAEGEAFIACIAAGAVTFAGRQYAFPSEAGNQVSVEVEPFHQGGAPQSRFCVLTMRGQVLAGMLDFERVDWELKASDPPYINLQELLLEYQTAIPAGHAIFESFYAAPIIIDGERSSLNGEDASISVKVEQAINHDDVRVGVIAIKAGEAAFRRTFKGSELEWTDDGKFAIGSVACKVPAGRAVQSVAALKDVAFHYWWVIDPQHVMNARKAVYEVVDPGLAVLRELLSHTSKGASRDFESAVAWLLWLLGFAVTHLGSNRQTQDAVDILASTPGGHFALVECTTGVISTDRKVPNLLRRRALVVEKLKQSNHNVSHVLPVLVTSCGKEEVQQEIAPAERLGVLVLTRNDLLELLDQTQFVMSPDDLYKQVEERLAAAAAAEVQPNLPEM